MINRLDRIDTPEWLATEMVQFAGRGGKTGVIADFAAGAGNLLAAAQRKWPRATLISNDKSPAAVRKLAHRFPESITSQSDFLKTKKLAVWRGKVSLALLNPPFSCRGGARHRIGKGEKMLASTGVAFLVQALEYLLPTGRAIAVLPAGCMSAEKDAAAWRWIRTHYAVTVFKKCNRRTFERCVVDTVVVGLVRRKKPRRSLWSPTANSNSVSLIRGKVQMHSAKWSSRKNATPLVHSTNLRGNCLTNLDRKVMGTRGAIDGPAVLFPRVGLPSALKMAILPRGRRVVLSDCVIAIPVASSVAANELLSQMQLNWPVLRGTYRGSCAPYTTIRRMGAALSRLIDN